MDFKTNLIRADEHGFKWIVSINGQDFDYQQGIGHAEMKRGEGLQLVEDPYSEAFKIAVLKAKRPFSRITLYDVEKCNYVFAKVPTLQDVLYCLFSDSSAHDMSFQDWCDNFGYDTDSIKDKKTYDDCIENYHKLRKALGRDYGRIQTETMEAEQ